MAAILLNPDVVIFTDPIGKNNHQHRWWAERGLIHWEDQVTGNYGTMTVRKALMHIQGIQEMIGNSRSARGYMMPDECQRYQEFVDGIVGLCKKARSQGMPDDPKVAKQKAAEIKAARQSRFVVLPGFNSSF